MSVETQTVRDSAKTIAEQPWLTCTERDTLTDQIAKAINDAVMAERERCAGVAEYFAQACVCAYWPDDARGASYYACRDVASAIRNDAPPKQPSLPINDDDLPF